MEGFGPQRPILHLISDHSQGSRLLKLRRLSTGSIAILAADYGSPEVFSIYCYVYLKAGFCQLFLTSSSSNVTSLLKPTSKK
ncbi:hypothetical protein BCON_0159g00140 [Botryotinia convoluta]|uniref:Uncharacterized protein n=1 Tax=Botryotinia convoluta TaxID=54673 RepID=A0A4Z1I4B5_9HELO|nr:hypothetical protein BCON_0159g00140 [Botryotinia convoluta]